MRKVTSDDDDPQRKKGKSAEDKSSKKGVKKKKKGKGRSKDLTEEERAEVKEKKSAALQEVQRRREELLTTFLKTKLEKEEELRRLNDVRLDDKWRRTMRAAKSESLRTQARLGDAAFRRASQAKDAVIAALLTELEEAEEQQYMTDRAHLGHLRALLSATHEARLAAEAKRHDERMQHRVQVLWRKELLEDSLLPSLERDLAILADATHDANVQHQQKTKKAAMEHNNQIALIRQTSFAHSLRLQAEEQLATLNSELAALLQESQSQLSDSWKVYKESKQRDDEYAAEQELQTRECQSLAKTIADLKTELAQLREDRANLVADLRTARTECTAHLHMLKAQTAVDKEHWLKLTKKVTLESEALRKKLFEKKQQLDKIIRLGYQCRKLEVMDDRAFHYLAPEKVAPSMPIDSEMVQDQHASLMESFKEKANDLLAALEPFFRRYSRVNLQTMVLTKQNETLKKESDLLKDQLRHCFQRMKLSDGKSEFQDNTLVDIRKLSIVENNMGHKSRLRTSSIRRPKTAAGAEHHVLPTLVTAAEQSSASSLGQVSLQRVATAKS
ncbi:unnamed protein product [Notodromas monacha]|uniref:Dynein regulatory complex subunit 2 n=1 Tax=Notodromas monacha TaxID=399045 RepID=A0A7R9G9X7_9CRUS|nr:unnamed protein product [Notodromas monacha]CAG0914723.1 unnamed protein product [Notodromas monacha]